MSKRAFINYSIDYPSLSKGDYLALFREYDEVSKRKYNFSIYDNYLYIAEITGGKTSGWLNQKKLKKLIAHSGLGLNELNSLFFDISTLNREEFRYSEIHTKMLGKLGKV